MEENISKTLSFQRKGAVRVAFDPVCSKPVNEKEAKFKITGKYGEQYFCSFECMKTFEDRENAFCAWSVDDWKKRHLRQMVSKSLLEPTKEKAAEGV